MSNYTEIIPPAYFLPGVCLTVASLLLLSLVQNAIHNLPYYRIPAVGTCRWPLLDRQSSLRFMSSARALIREGFEQVWPSTEYESCRLIWWDTTWLGLHNIPGHFPPRADVDTSSKVCE